jgi:hypothetical protein
MVWGNFDRWPLICEAHGNKIAIGLPSDYI